MLLRLVRGVRADVRLIHQAHDTIGVRFADGVARERGVQRIAQRAATRLRENDRQALFLLPQVRARGFARHSGVAPQSQNVVGHLEREAEFDAELAEARDRRRVVRRHRRADGRRRAEQRRRLAADHLRVMRE